jgi:glutathione gamma-glutamylcysteinyltransferase
MMLNALEVDPGRLWKGPVEESKEVGCESCPPKPTVEDEQEGDKLPVVPWRFYTQEMLDCCRPLDQVQRVGITLDEFVCLGRCNGLEVTVYGGGRGSSCCSNASQCGDTEVRGLDGDGEEEFRRIVKDVCSGEGGMLAMSYSRASLGQTGEGHFSPLAGYCEEEDMVLVLDVARFKVRLSCGFRSSTRCEQSLTPRIGQYPSYWISVKDAYASMLRHDPTTNKPRSVAQFLHHPPQLTRKPQRIRPSIDNPTTGSGYPEWACILD